MAAVEEFKGGDQAYLNVYQGPSAAHVPAHSVEPCDVPFEVSDAGTGTL